MGAKKVREKLLSFALALCMLVGIVPVSAFAAQDTSVDTTGTNVEIVASYAQQLVNANRKDDDDYSKGGFTWDTEGKKDSWRYFNGVMMDAFLMLDQGTTAKTAIGTYVDAFYNSNINDDGTIKNYITGELDSVPTALGLFDLLGSTNADKYKKAIQYIYTQLEGQTSYEKCGGNYLHKQKKDGTPTDSWSTWNIGLDGLYMAQPFLMECANAIAEGTLTLTDADGEAVTSAAIYEAVYNRFAWVAEKMYDETTGLYHHGWNVSAGKGNGHFWGRGIGWYAVALVDVIEMMPAGYQDQMISYLTKLFDGMLKYQDAETGMWYNVVNNVALSGNKLETSVSAMMAYALMKAYNNGYVTDAKYGQAGLAAFNGVIANKVTTDSEGSYTVADIYQKSGVGDSDEYYTQNNYVADEAKGVGPLIMAATVANTTAKNLPATETPEEQPSVVTDEENNVSVSGTTATGITVEDKSRDQVVASALNGKLAKGFFAYDITLDGYTKDDTATVTMPAPSGANAVYYVSDDGSTVEETEDATFGDGTVTFTTTHFSTYAAGNRSTGGSSTGGSTDDSPSVDKTEENWGLDPAEKEDYPEYPADGAVRIDKTATGPDFNSTGVVKVELDAAGISVKQGVDVVLVVDVSNSMGWTDNWFVGMTEDEVAGAKDNVKIPQGSADDKLDQAMKSAQEFANILLAGNTDNASSNNSISFVTFAGFDEDNTNESGDRASYIDSVQTVFTNVEDAASANTAFDNTEFTDYDVDGTSVTYTLQIGSTNNDRTVSGINRGNTNYDYAFAEANAAVNKVKESHGGASAYAKTGRETVVVFMTDGAPSHYNNNRLNGSHADTRYGTENEYAEVGAYNGREEDNAETWLTYINKPNTYARTLNENINSFYAVGFDLAHGGFGNYSFAEGDLQPVLEGLAGDNTVDVELVSNGTALQAFYRSLAQKIKLAGTEAQVTDTISRNFDLQMTKTTGTGDQHGTLSTDPTIEVTSYDLYTKATTTDPTLIGTRTGTSTTLEKVTFNADGTAAYSDQIGNGTTNIMSTANGVTTIAAKYFTYTKNASGVETFVWNIGDITDDEVALSYYAYLTGTMEGTREKGEVYYTNEGATLEYVDINGKYAKKDFPKPAVAWGGATTSFEYYLVNEKGEPVNRAGQVIPFANRIVFYGDSKALNLNQDITIPAQTINASAHLPEGYVLYDVEAYYTVSTASDSSLNKGITVSEPSEKAKEAPQTGAQTTIIVYPQNPTANETYIQTRVAFGVRWDLTPSYAEYELVKDQIVLDYGKAIQADVLANDTTIPEGYTGTLVGFTAYNANANLKQMQLSAGSETYTTDNGTYTIVDGKVNFQLSTMLSEVEKVFCVVQVTETADTNNYYYLYEELDIIPATSVYYETDFADGVFTFDNSSGWDKEATVKDDVVADGPQDDGKIGQNQYGYDSSYKNDKYQSNGSSYVVTGQGSTKTTANFSFTGTGFDIISRTGNDEGFIRVSVYSDAGKTNLEKRVTVLNKSESDLTLYQIPVVSVEDLSQDTHYVEIGVSAPKESTSPEYTGLENNGQFHFDAVRIYNPLNASASASATSDEGIAYAAYTADGEATPSISEVRNMLIAANTFDESANTSDPEYEEGVSFIDRTQEGAKLAEYKTIGPNNEVYLTGEQAIGFKVQVDGALPASIDIGAKSANGETVTLHATILDSEFNVIKGAGTGDDGVAIDSSTSQYFNLMGSMTVDAVFGDSNYVYVLIDNLGGGVLSITDLKIAYGTDTTGSVQVLSDPEMVSEFAEILDEDTAAVDELTIESAAFTTASIKRNKTATLEVTTSAAVASLKVFNSAGREMSIAYDEPTTNADGTKSWTVTFKVTSVGNQTFTVTPYGADETAGTSATATIKVTVR